MTAETEKQSRQSGHADGPSTHGQSEKQTLVLRSDKGGLQIVLSRTARVCWTAIGVAVFGWLVYSSYALISADFAIESKEKTIVATASKAAEVRGAYDDLIAQVRTYQERFAEVSQQLASSQLRLVDLMGQNSQLKENHLLTTDRLRSVEDRAAAMTAQLGEKESILDGLLDQNLGLKSDLASAHANLDLVEAEQDELRGAESRVQAATAELSDREAALQNLRNKNGALESDLDNLLEKLVAVEAEAANRGDVQSRVLAITAKLSETENALDGLKEENSVLKSDLASASADLSDLQVERTELRRLADQNIDLQAESASMQARLVTFEDTESELNALLDRNRILTAELVSTSDMLRSAEQQRAIETERAERLSAEIGKLEKDLELSTDRVVTLSAAMAAAESDAQEMNIQHNDTAGDREALRKQVEQLEKRIASLQRSQQDFLLYVTERTINTIDEAERTISMTGLGVEWLLDRARNLPAALGGPFVELNASMLAASELRQEVSVLDSHMNRWERLQYILRMLPLAGPVDHYRVASRFGKRKDPLNGRWAMHYGLDLAGPLRSPILATSAGTVTFAGWSASYGRTIEIEHGMGIRTRYGHLRSIAVKKGDRLKFREKIGLLGSSGRSTGPHVHYEILVDGKPVDPEDFLKAGKYQFKG